jgi:ferric-dicitrate binding protein FerR (iron transport regulator)
LQNIHKSLGIEHLSEKQKTRVVLIQRLYRGIAVAASICLITGLAFLLTGKHRESVGVVKNAANTAPAISGLPRLMQLVNGSDSTMPVDLKDGSTVQLGKNSSITYYEPFVNDRRDISLRGIALFKVAKDKKRPFTVYAGGIATRALGTRFWVNAADDKKVVVKLLDGKVVVNTTAGSGMTMSDVYLTPGQELAFDKISRQYMVNAMIGPDRTAGRPSPEGNKAELIFNKEPLDRVFKRVGNLYKIPLAFRKEDMGSLYFTGTFLKSDDLHLVLSTICNVNDLLFREEQDSIIITKTH